MRTNRVSARSVSGRVVVDGQEHKGATPGQKKVDVKIVSYPGESDKGPFPVPDETPIEGWPVSYTRGGVKATLDETGKEHPTEPSGRRP